MAYLDILDEMEWLSKFLTSNGIECVSITKNGYRKKCNLQQTKKGGEYDFIIGQTSFTVYHEADMNYEIQ